jgi:type IV pilus assembly protein PilE
MNTEMLSDRSDARRDRMLGVTLIELMVVIVVVAILASIAVPSYQTYVLRSHRVEAKTALLNLAAAQEKYYLQHSTYAANGDLEDAPPDGLGIPATTENGWYSVAINSADEDGFTATATARGVQLKDTKCKTLTINALGVKGAKTSADVNSTSECWPH